MRNLMTDLERALDGVVGELAQVSAESLEALEATLERALTHVMVERYMRANERVSHLRPVG